MYALLSRELIPVVRPISSRDSPVHFAAQYMPETGHNFPCSAYIRAYNAYGRFPVSGNFLGGVALSFLGYMWALMRLELTFRFFSSWRQLILIHRSAF